jgi:hypothetical protein
MTQQIPRWPLDVTCPWLSQMPSQTPKSDEAVVMTHTADGVLTQPTGPAPSFPEMDSTPAEDTP